MKIFGNEFVKQNGQKCQIIYDNKTYNLSEYFELENLKSKIDNILEIKLKGINNITNSNFMFHKCTSLISLSNVSIWDTNNIIDMSGLFIGCSSLKSLSDISGWKTNNVTNLSFLFDGCSSLISIPDISKWNTSKVTNIQDIFRDCSSLKFLPDISKWDTSNVIHMQDLFCRCSSLISLPDISKWNTSKVTIMSFMFAHCNSLLKFSINTVTFKNKFDLLIKQKQSLNENEIYADLENDSNLEGSNNIYSNCFISDIYTNNDDNIIEYNLQNIQLVEEIITIFGIIMARNYSPYSFLRTSSSSTI